MTPSFQTINVIMSSLNREFDLPDHLDLNGERYPWSTTLFGQPQIYASRLWEFPFAIQEADLSPGMTCADIGCGRTPFTIYLDRIARCKVTGFDPDVFETGDRHKAFGVPQEFIQRTGLTIKRSGMDQIDVPDNFFDRVFCISVIEHVEALTARKGIREMARILKPGGRLILTMDVELFNTLSEADPLSLVWESGLFPCKSLDLQWPEKRFGNSYSKGRSADVFGLVLEKRDYRIERQYQPGETAGELNRIEGWRIASSRAPKWRPLKITPWRQRLRKAANLLLHGICREP
ncbi:MAG: class I SAM-dependent methyltransferase [bacterium]